MSSGDPFLTEIACGWLVGAALYPWALDRASGPVEVEVFESALALAEAELARL